MDRRQFLSASSSAAALLSASSSISAQTQSALPSLMTDAAWLGAPEGTFCKSFTHDADGRVSAATLRALRDALIRRDIDALERLPINNEIRLVSPLSALSWTQWKFAAQVKLPEPPPAWDSDALADQALELYWMALLRDEKLVGLERERAAREAATELAGTATYRGTTVENLFRLPFANARHGYALSLLLWLPIPYGAHPWWQAYKTPFPNQDFLTKWDEFQRVQSGAWPSGILEHNSELHYLRTGRELAEYVRWDFSYQAFINAANIVLGDPHRPRQALARGNPYKTARTQNAFVSLGGPQLLALIGRAADKALQAAWHVKWLMYPLLRPEEYGALIETNRVSANARLRASQALVRTKAKSGNYLLPQAYPEGAPAHPSYVSGHATIAGACATILKAYIDPEYKFRFPLEPTRSGRDWGEYSGPATKAGIEIDKLATNIACGRQWAGIHWLADSVAGLRLGEQVGLAVLAEAKSESFEASAGWFKGFELTTFDGKAVTV